MADKLLDIQIVRALTAIGPLTRKQIINRINENQIDVEASLDALVTMGCLRTELSSCFKNDFEYRLAPHFGESDCKRVDHRQKVALYVARHGAESKEIIPVTSGIAFSEGLDRAIWKAANTGRWMMVREIRDILMNAGFRKDDIVTRVQYHINTGKWFERQAGHKNSQFFMLKSDIECPEIPGTVRASAPTKIVANTLPVALSETKIEPSAPILTIDHFVAKEDQAKFPHESVAALATPDQDKYDGYFSMVGLEPNVLKTAQDTVKTMVGPDATLHEAIWAVLSDTEEYSYADFVVLLEPLGFSGKQISPLLSKRFADGLLSRRLRQIDGKWVNIYKKNGELPVKFTSGKSVVSGIIEAQQPTEVVVIAAAQEEKPVEKPQLFETVIRMKGVAISLNEFGMLYKELSDAGFVRDMHKSVGTKPGPNIRLLTTTHEVKGVTFTREELLDLTHAMHNTANHFKMALVV